MFVQTIQSIMWVQTLVASREKQRKLKTKLPVSSFVGMHSVAVSADLSVKGLPAKFEDSTYSAAPQQALESILKAAAKR